MHTMDVLYCNSWDGLRISRWIRWLGRMEGSTEWSQSGSIIWGPITVPFTWRCPWTDSALVQSNRSQRFLELWEIAPNSPPETAAPICILHIWSVVLHWELTKCSNWWSFALFRLAQIAGFAELSLTSNDISCQDDSRWMFWSTDFPYKK